MVLTASCTPLTDRLQNSGLDLQEGKDVPDHWKLEEKANVEIFPVKKENRTLAGFRSETGGRFTLSQEVLLDSGEYFLLVKFYTRINHGEFFISAGSSDYFGTARNHEVCERTVFAIYNRQPARLAIRFGFTGNTAGRAYVESIQLIRIKYDFAGSRAFVARQYLTEKLQLTPEFAADVDGNVEKLARALNTTFLSRGRHDALGWSEAPDSVFSVAGLSYLQHYARDLNNNNAYCQKSSLALDDLLRLFGVPTRQVHWQRNCTGFHQFLEYRDEQEGRWEILDPYYGIKYIDAAGRELNFEDVEKLVRQKKLTGANIKRLDIGRLLYSQEEILSGWYESTLAIHVN